MGTQLQASPAHHTRNPGRPTGGGVFNCERAGKMKGGRSVFTKDPALQRGGTEDLERVQEPQETWLEGEAQIRGW